MQLLRVIAHIKAQTKQFFLLVYFSIDLFRLRQQHDALPFRRPYTLAIERKTNLFVRCVARYWRGLSLNAVDYRYKQKQRKKIYTFTREHNIH